jgi:hypothetical protein
MWRGKSQIDWIRFQTEMLEMFGNAQGITLEKHEEKQTLQLPRINQRQGTRISPNLESGKGISGPPAPVSQGTC